MVTAVVLAAGASTRMGRPKLLLPLGGEPIVRRTVRQVCEAGFDEVLVVVGAEAARVREALAGLPCRAVENPDYAAGMGTSFRTGVAHVADASEAALFALADQAFVTTAGYRRMLDLWRATRPLLAIARFGAVHAPPHIFARALFEELSVLEHGAKPVLARHAADAVTLEFPPDQLVDIDTPEDYERAVARAASAS